jgi:competence protein ComEC
MLSTVFKKTSGVVIRWSFLLFFIGLTIVVWYIVWQETPQGILEVYFLAVGQGDAILIKGPSGGKILLDAGPNDNIINELSNVLPFYDRTIDLLIASHPDLDHIGGFQAVIDRFLIGAFMEPGIEVEKTVWRRLTETLNQESIERVTARRGMKIHLGEAVINIFFPDRDVSSVDPNDGSIVAKLDYGETSYLFMGDAPKKIEQYLILLEAGDLQSDVLKVGHHGSRTSTSIGFVALVNPDYAVIQAGLDNRYGHPHREVVSILENIGAKILETAELGTINIVSDGWQINCLNCSNF